MVDLIIWLVVGGIVGWLASMVMRTALSRASCSTSLSESSVR